MKIIILDVAETELDDAIQYYENELVGLGIRFLNAVSSTINRITDFPKAYPSLSARTRRCVIAHFPYGILYQHREELGEIMIVAIGHLHRSPDYWFSRA